jgi:hypothetical protein
MKTASLMNEFREMFPQHGEFTLSPDQSVSTAVKEHDVPNKPGAYVISSVTPSRTEVVYIGKSGTVNKDGSWKNQGLRKRLTKKQDNESRSVFFKRYMEKHSLLGLHFEWFVTFGSESEVLPIFAEAQLLQAFFCEHQRLPHLNACA